MERIRLGLGTEVKMIIGMEPIGGEVTLAECNFVAKFFTKTGRFVSIGKEKMEKEDANSYVVVVPTKTMQAGDLHYVLEVDVEDSAADDGLRHEVSLPHDTGVTLVALV